MIPLPRIVFVLGKGGVGRSSVAAALGMSIAATGARTLVLEWAVQDVIGPWFGAEPIDVDPVEIAPHLSVVNYRLDATLRAYFVDHLHLGLFYRRVVSSRQVEGLIDAAPGIAELLFLGQLWWLTTLAPAEKGLVFDTIIVDAPATGHATSLLELPETLSRLRVAGLLELELERVRGMMRDPRWTGSIVVATPEDLVAEETLELVPRVTRDLGRRPLAAVINRSARDLIASSSDAVVAELTTRLTGPAARGVEVFVSEIKRRVECETSLTRALEGATEHGVISLADVLADSAGGVVRTLGERLRDHQPAGSQRGAS